jgi:pimeloyl-ACP methyl ester carboxylesterase
MAVFEHNGRIIGYNVNGSGPAVLAFHGTTQAGNAWDQVREACTQERTWIVFEFPGSGESQMPTEPLDLDAIVSDAVALMKYLGHETFHVVGYSLGAVCALHTAAQYKSEVLSVTSLCGWSRSDARMRGTFDLWRRLIAIGPDLFIRYALVDGYTPETLEVIEPMWEGAVAMAASSVQPGSDAHLELDISIDIEEDLSLISSPCLVIGGLQDRWVDISKSRHIAAQIPHSSLVELPAGHLVIGEMASEIGSLIANHTS